MLSQGYKVLCHHLQLCPQVEWVIIKLDFTGLPISLELHCLLLTSSKDGMDILKFNIRVSKSIKFFISLKQKLNTFVDFFAKKFLRFRLRR